MTTGFTVQQTNDDMINWLSAHFQGRYEPQYGLSNAIALHRNLPQLRGFWPMSSVDENGDVYDLSGQGRTLTNNSASVFGVDGLAPYIEFDGIADYLSRTDEAGFDITGELTIGGWFYRRRTATSEALMSKWLTNNFSYLLWFEDPINISFDISSDGLATGRNSVSYAGSQPANAWYHIVGRFIPSTSQSIFVNGIETADTTSIAASIFSGSADFEIGRIASATNYAQIYSCINFLCADALSDATIFTLFQQTRPLFGV